MSDNPIDTNINYTDAIVSLSQIVHDMIETQKSILTNISNINDKYNSIQRTADLLTNDIKKEQEEVDVLISVVNNTIDSNNNSSTNNQNNIINKTQQSDNQDTIKPAVNLWKNPKLSRKNNK